MKQIICLCEGRFGLPPFVKVTAAGQENRCHHEENTELEWSDVDDSQIPHFPNPLTESSGRSHRIDNDVAGVVAPATSLSGSSKGALTATE
jgi:hypothetical protein